MEMRRKEKLRMLISDGFRMRLTNFKGRFKMGLMKIRIKNFSNRLISLCNRFWKYQKIKIIKLQMITTEESLYTQSKYYYLDLLVIQIHSRIRESSLRSPTIRNSRASSCKKNHFDGTKKANSVQSKKQSNSAIIEAKSISKQLVSHA